jgi:Protein tyrosine and serine/threonine kinase
MFPAPPTATFRGAAKQEDHADAVPVPDAAATTTGGSKNSSSSSSSNHSNPTRRIVVDAARLRRALRLVYCLQKERGASCCYYASGKCRRNSGEDDELDNNGSLPHYDDDDPLLSSARRDTDCAWNMMVACSKTAPLYTATSSLDDMNNHHHHRHHHHHHRRSDSFQSLYAIQAPLARIRKMVETGNCNTSNSSNIPGCGGVGGAERAGFHKIFVCFNTLISSVVHEYLLLQTARQRRYLNKRINKGNNNNNNNNKSNHASAASVTRLHANIRAHSSSNDLFSQQAPVSILRGNNGKSSSSSNGDEQNLSHSEHRPRQQQQQQQRDGPQHHQDHRNFSEDGVSYFSAMVGSLMLGVDDNFDAVAPPPAPPPPAPASASPFYNNGDSESDSDDDGDGVAIVLSDEDKNEKLSSHPFELFQQQQSQHLNEKECAANNVVTRASSPHQSHNRRAQSYSPSARHTTTRKTCAAGTAVVPMRRIESGDIDILPLDDEHEEQEPRNSYLGSDSLLGGDAAEKSKRVTILQQPESEESPEHKVVHLLDLLDIFIKLKESTGIERATLTSLLAAVNANAAAASANSNHHCHQQQQHDDNDTQFLLADLVLQVENQRSLLQRLQQLRDSQGGSGSLKNLVHDLVSLSPRLAQLQHDLLQGGGDTITSRNGHRGAKTTSAIMETVLGASLKQSNSNQLWDLLTVYIDKLHSLELLIVEEIECSAAYWMTPSSSSAPVDEATAAVAASSSSSSVVSQPQSMMMMNAPARKPLKSHPQSMATTVVSDTNVPPPPPPPSPPPAVLTSSSISSQDELVLLRASFCEFASDQDLLDHVQALDPDEIKRLLVTRLQQQVQVCKDIHNNDTNKQPDGGAYSESSSTASRSQSSKLLPLPNDNHNNGNSDANGNEGSESEGSPANRIDDLLKELCHAPSSKEWEIDLYQIRFLKRIGQGSAGTTYLGDWGGTNVAVKVASITEMGLDGWRKEVQALQMLHHPNIIRLLGSVYHPSPLTFCLVLEYCNAGDLSDALLKPTPPEFWSHVAISIAKGMTYLHHRGIIHVSAIIVFE